MHFLSHYYTELPINSPFFAAGLLIPDLTPRFTKAYNSVIRQASHSAEEDLALIHEGIIAHYQGDKRFHNSPAFMQHLSTVLQSFQKEGLSRARLRLSVIAHLSIEMLIDRQLLLENEPLSMEFYQTLGQANVSVLETYFDSLALNDMKRPFFVNFQFFKQRQFLYLFKNMENIVFGLNRVYSSVTGVEFTDDEKRRLLSALHNIDGQMRYSWQEILKG